MSEQSMTAGDTRSEEAGDAACVARDAPRGGRCALLGRPNVGKSTLLNTLLGDKLVIVAPTPGTTRNPVLGVYASTRPPTQIAFVDTPGMGPQKNELAKLLVEETKTGVGQSDVNIVLTDVPAELESPRVHPGDEDIIRMAEEARRPTLLVVNKADRLRDKRMLLPLMEAYKQRFPFEAYVPVSATQKTQLDALVGEIRERLPRGLLYDEDVLTDRPERFFVAELVREAVLHHTHEEVPHGSAVAVDHWLEEGERTRIAASIVVDKASHKKIVIGAGGQLIKRIGSDARAEIERFLDRKVHLELWVKVIPGWTKNPSRARRLLGEQST